ncbi:anthranilate synthase component I family protein [Nonlabens marinus]|uniref:Para-aminobenzoate synthase, aminase component n=1 Tax=Nonlabens marinus S1-08 TaxID=1454201 RepID=W8VXZ0_9FLAO|nr:chorismate-binding protein [Nonlabens marinus]BAO56762.1 para-aminobenzoate synthase, aminase component [Nonlabens marinus S1-08]
MNQQRYTHSFSLLNSNEFKKKLISFYEQETYFVFLDSNDFDQSEYTCLCGVGAIDVLTCVAGNAFHQLERFQYEHQDWMFGYLGYDLKNELEPLSSHNRDILCFPDLQFFVPEIVMEINEKSITIHSYEEERSALKSVLEEINNQMLSKEEEVAKNGHLEAIDSKEAYLEKAQKFLNHIHRGDIYEANLCTEFHALEVELDSVKAFAHLNKSSAPPFAAYARFAECHIISASPERYLKKMGKQLLSQPIKGTAPRAEDSLKDEEAKQELLANQKERSENVMIVDLVRNDLSKVAQKGSVKVSELFGLYTFPQVHHMISSITATLDQKNKGIDAVKATFPMGSMTGAPKISAMKIIEQTESFKRGVYSGAVGYFTPSGDFDFNVVIRTILYNDTRKVVSLSVGSAITAAAIPEAEYQECFVKAAALMKVLELQGIHFS